MRNPWLIAGGVLSAIAALLHIAIIFGGPEWYRVFGAGEGMARAVERGMRRPHFIALGIATMLAIWSAYAFAGAGLLPRLPLMTIARADQRDLPRARRVAFTRADVRLGTFWVASSLIVLAYGVVYAVGTWQAWPTLTRA